VILAAVGVGIWMLSKNASAMSGAEIPTGGGFVQSPMTTPPDLPYGTDAISQVVQKAKLNPAVQLQNQNYELISKSDPALRFAGSFSLAELQQLTTGQAVVQGNVTTKEEQILTTTVAGSGGRPTMSTQVLQVSPVASSTTTQSSFDKMVAANFAAQGKSVPYTNVKK